MRRCLPTDHMRMVLAWARPPVLAWLRPLTGEENHDGMLRRGGAGIGHIWMVLACVRPPTGEENHEGMLRRSVAGYRQGVDGMLRLAVLRIG